MRTILFPGVLAAMLSATVAQAAVMTFNSTAAGDNATTRSAWLAAAGITTPQFLVDFESGYTNNQNINGAALGGGLVIADTSGANSVLIKSGNGSIGGSNPVGSFAATHSDRDYFVLDFSANPVDYVAFLDIDHTARAGNIITYVGGATSTFGLDSTNAGGNSAEFFGIFRNDQPQITRIQLHVFGDGLWGLDNIEFGDIVPVTLPLPTSAALLGIGLLTLSALGGRRK